MLRDSDWTKAQVSLFRVYSMELRVWDFEFLDGLRFAVLDFMEVSKIRVQGVSILLHVEMHV